jgi:glycosyltransferase involved in cell wall biosynthesis
MTRETQASRVAFVPTEPLARSGVAILAKRWRAAANHAGIRAELLAGNRRGQAERAIQEFEGTAIVLGLPFDPARAQEIVNSIVSSDRRVILLWDRAGHTLENSADGVHSLEAVREAWTLNPLHNLSVRRLLPSAKVSVVPLAIPDVFFRARPAKRHVPYAAFLGRFSKSKGAPELARAWVEEVFPATGLPLTMAGSGMEYGASEALVADVALANPMALRTIKLMSEKSRASFLASASLVIYPGTHDYLPQSLAEAFGAGALVAATDIDGYRPLARPGSTSIGLSLDLANIVDAVRLSLSSTDSAEFLARNGRELVRREHSTEVTGQRLLDLLRSSPAP